MLDNDFDLDGERPVIAGATVKLMDRDGGLLGETTTSATGVAAFATPATIRDEDLTLEVVHPDFNRRRIRIDGAPIHPDLRHLLYAELS